MRRSAGLTSTTVKTSPKVADATAKRERHRYHRRPPALEGRGRESPNPLSSIADLW